MENDGYTHDAFTIADDYLRALGTTVFESETLYVVKVADDILK